MSSETSSMTVYADEPGPPERDRVAAILQATGRFRADEVAVALEVFDAFCYEPDLDYRALGAFAEPRELIGFVLYGATPCTVGTWDIYWIAVHPDRQRQGVGSDLLERAEGAMRRASARMCVIETSGRSDYAATRRFYGAHGYEEVGRITDFYEDGDDRITYVKRFDGRGPGHRGKARTGRRR